MEKNIDHVTMKDICEKQEILDRLEEIQNEIEELVSEAKEVVSEYPGAALRAEAYWVPGIKGMLRNDGRSCMVTMEETIDEIRNEYE